MKYESLEILYQKYGVRDGKLFGYMCDYSEGTTPWEMNEADASIEITRLKSQIYYLEGYLNRSNDTEA